jgi:hypothetical protein
MLHLSLLLTAALPAADFQKAADEAKWDWPAGGPSLVESVLRAPNDYTIELVRPKSTFGKLTIRLLDGDKVRHTLEAHGGTTFVLSEGVFYYTDYHPSATGCSVVAYDLKAGKELWKTSLKGLGPIAHFQYLNEAVLDLDGGALRVRGAESAGKYLEYVDLKTGKTVGHRVFKE